MAEFERVNLRESDATVRRVGTRAQRPLPGRHRPNVCAMGKRSVREPVRRGELPTGIAMDMRVCNGPQRKRAGD
jgi:hypothetical protein